MTKEKKLKKVGVNKIMDMLFRSPYSRTPDYYAEKSGFLHQKFGYTNSISFSKYFEGEEYNFLIIGVPDKIENSKIVEFKVAFSKKSLNKQKKIGETQANIYAYLGGFPEYRVDIYKDYDQKLEVGEEKHASYPKAIKDIKKGLKIYERLLNLKKDL